LSEEIKNGISVVFRFPNGKKLTQSFNRTDPISSLYDFVWLKEIPTKKFYLVDLHSKQKLLDLEIPLMVIEDDHSAMITVCEI
jgi:hypothetical protein